MNTRWPFCCARVALCAWFLIGATCLRGAEPKTVPHGRLETINETLVITVDGTPEQIGTAYGTLLADKVQKVVRAVITDGVAADPDAYKNILAGGKVMERFQPEEYRAEMKALAEAAGVKYDDLLLLQYFGDVRRCISGAGKASMCTAFAVLPPYTRGDLCLVGRNLDYFDKGVSEYAAILAYYRPAGRIPFVTVTWAGVINGWTLLSEKGLVVANNTSFDQKKESLEGISTCFLLRFVAERAETVEQGLDLVKKAKRACGTNMLIASGKPPAAAIVEFDHEGLAVRKADDGFVGAANGFLKLYREDGATAAYSGRTGAALDLVKEKKGVVDYATNIAGAPGVPIASMNLHCATLDATNLRFRVAMGKIPACEQPFRAFRLTPAGVVADDKRD